MGKKTAALHLGFGDGFEYVSPGVLPGGMSQDERDRFMSTMKRRCGFGGVKDDYITLANRTLAIMGIEGRMRWFTPGEIFRFEQMSAGFDYEENKSHLPGNTLVLRKPWTGFAA